MVEYQVKTILAIMVQLIRSSNVLLIFLPQRNIGLADIFDLQDWACHIIKRYSLGRYSS